MGRISWKVEKSNDFVLKKLKTKRQLLARVKQRQLQYFGHIKRHQSIKKDILRGRFRGRGPEEDNAQCGLIISRQAES